MRICIIYAGISTEREISIKTAEQIMKSLDKDKYDICELKIDKTEDIFKIKDMNVDLAFIALHGKFGEDGRVQAILEAMNIRYTGPGVLASGICMDKDIAKRVLSTYGIRTAKWWTIRKGEEFTYPKEYEKLIVKPNSGGSSIGVHFISNQQELDEALKDIFTMDDEAIMEEVIEGDEVSVPIIDGVAYPPIKIEALKGTYFDYTSKYSDGGAREYVTKFSDNLEKELKEFTEKAYYAAKCKGYSRVDFLVRDDKAYFMEVNTLPGMTATSLLPKSLASVGIGYRETLELLIKASLGELKEFTEKAYYAAKCKGYSRVDFLVRDDKAYFMEVNTLPGMTATSLLPKSLASVGIGYRETLELLIKASLGE